MTNLIALIDGSIYSHSVCDHAAWAARRLEASVRVVHAIGRRDTASAPANLSGSIGLGARTALLEELAELDAQKAKLSQKRGRLLLEEAEARLREQGVGQVATLLRNGDVVETAHELEPEADLFVIGKRGEAADFARLHLGSNLERVVRAIHKPILVAARSFKPVERFLVAFDGGTSAMKAVDHIARSWLFAGLDCRLLMAGADTPAARKQLEDAAALLRAAGYAVQADIEPGGAAAAIARRVEADGIDLLVMGAYGHSRIRSMIIGSTTTEMIRSCLVPVMLFR
ncbi:MAG: universal stress protein [Alphaproteobacteria bacterium]|nr:universal stress protein [Alphaproteobacteria bacterium]MCB9927822.1 universal stress protein [Alphaproteobacteria bacterium]